MDKKIMVSGIKPTGELTLGNYLGAIKNFINYQYQYKLYIFIANLHAITTKFDPKEIKKNTRDLIALYLALGLDPKEVVLFKQSDVPGHSELGYIMTCSSYMGEMSRMTQYKDYIANQKNQNIPVGIFIYPGLMASDIFLYDADMVPVGQDQKQHVELARDIAIRFNNKYGPIIKIPEIVIAETGAKIYSLSHPDKKMSKSDSDDKGCIYLLDSPEVAKKKIMSAVTDTDNKIFYDPVNKPGISNLLVIQSLITDTPIPQLVDKYQNTLYGQFKKDVAESVANFLKTIQEKYSKIINDDLYIDTILLEGAAKAHKSAIKKVNQIKEVIGLN